MHGKKGNGQALLFASVNLFYFRILPEGITKETNSFAATAMI